MGSKKRSRKKVNFVPLDPEIVKSAPPDPVPSLSEKKIGAGQPAEQTVLIDISCYQTLTEIRIKKTPATLY